MRPKGHLASLLPAGFAIGMLLVALLSTACLKAEGLTEEAAGAARAADNGDRTDCGEIMGGAFRSAEERRWFDENCSAWPLVPVEQTPKQARGAPLAAECYTMRGRPYESNDQRAWYLANCIEKRPGATNAPSGQPPPASQQPQQGGDNADRQDCNAIRGTPYRSNAERDWFLKNCPNPALVATSGPDRTDCNEIRGTAYRSPAERDWFLKNCPNPAPTVQEQRPIIQLPLQLRPAPTVTVEERRDTTRQPNNQQNNNRGRNSRDD